jgi:hypothetical protein
MSRNTYRARPSTTICIPTAFCVQLPVPIVASSTFLSEGMIGYTSSSMPI